LRELRAGNGGTASEPVTRTGIPRAPSSQPTPPGRAGRGPAEVIALSGDGGLAPSIRWAVAGTRSSIWPRSTSVA